MAIGPEPFCRPILAWADKFKVEMTSSEQPPQSWLIERLSGKVLAPAAEWIDHRAGRSGNFEHGLVVAPERAGPSLLMWILGGAVGLPALYGSYHAVLMLHHLPVQAWGSIGLGLLATFLRVCAALLIALLWTVPAGVTIGTSPRAAGILQPVVQITASVPATALFPVLLLALLRVLGGRTSTASLPNCRWSSTTSSP